MEENSIKQEDENVNQGCASCGSIDIEEGYNIPLCSRCRETLVKKPIPVWIKGVALIVFLVMIFSLIKFPSTIGVGIHYQRGINAENQKKYITAAREFEIAAKQYPDSTMAVSKLFIAQYKNSQVDDAYKTFEKIAGKEFSDTELVDRINQYTKEMDALYIPSKTLMDELKKAGNLPINQRIKELTAYVSKYPNDLYVKYYLANDLYDVKKYDESQRYAEEIMQKYPDFSTGNLFIAAIYREKADYATAIEYCNKAFSYNIEDPEAFVQLSRIELKRHNDKMGLEYAKKAYELDNQDDHVVANLAMAYHYNNMIKERDEMVSKMEMEKRDQGEIQLVKSIFSGKLKWR